MSISYSPMTEGKRAPASIASVVPFWAPASWLRGLCEAAISGYQRWLSPHKGYCCAHRLVHKGESCSQYVKRAIVVGGVRQAVGLARARFAACGRAARRLERIREHAARTEARLHERVEAVTRKVEELPDAIEATVDGLEVAADLVEAAPDLFRVAFDAAGQGLEATGEVLAGGVDMLGSACEVLGPAAECAGGCSL